MIHNTYHDNCDSTNDSDEEKENSDSNNRRSRTLLRRLSSSPSSSNSATTRTNEEDVFKTIITELMIQMITGGTPSNNDENNFSGEDGFDDNPASLRRTSSSEGSRILGVHQPPSSQDCCFHDDQPVLTPWRRMNLAASSIPIMAVEQNFFVNSVAFSPDGTKLAVGCGDTTTTVYDLVRCRDAPVMTMKRDGQINSVAFSPDGTKLAVGSGDTTVTIYDVVRHSDVPIMTMKRDGGVNAIAFSPDGTKLAVGSKDETATVYDVVSRSDEPIMTVKRDDLVASVAFSPDGTMLAVGSWDQTATLYDVVSCNDIPIMTFSCHGVSSVILSLAFSPDGTKLAVGGNMDYTAAVYDIVSGSDVPVMTVMTRGGEGWSVAFSPDGTKLAVGSKDKTATVYDVVSGSDEPIMTVRRYGWVTSVAFSPDGIKLAVGSFDNTATIYDVVSCNDFPIMTVKRDDGVKSVALSVDGTKLAVGRLDNTATVYDIVSGSDVPVMTVKRGDWISSVAFSPDGTKLAVGSKDETATVYDVMSGSDVPIMTVKRAGAVFSVAFSPDGTKLAIGSDEDTAVVCDVASQSDLAIMAVERDGGVTSVAFSPDGTKLAVGSFDNTATVYDIKGSGCDVPIKTVKRNDGVFSVSFSPDGTKLAIGSKDKTATVYDVLVSGSDAPIMTLKRDNWVLSVAFSPDGTKLAVGGCDGTFSIYWISNASPLVDIISSNISYSVAYSIILDSSFKKEIVAIGYGDGTFLVVALPHIADAKPHTMHHTYLIRDDIISGNMYFFVSKLFSSQQVKQSSQDELKKNIRIPNLMRSLVCNNNQHKTVAFLVEKCPEPILSLALTSLLYPMFGDLLKCLRQHHYLSEIQFLLESKAFSIFTVTKIQLDSMLEELVQFAKSNSTTIVSAMLKAGENGFVRHHKIYLKHEEIPVTMNYLTRSSASFCDLMIWTMGYRMYKRDEQERVQLKTLRVLLPDLGSKRVIEALLRMNSHQPFHKHVLQMVINTHWNTWARYHFGIQGIVYLVWLLCLTAFFEVQKHGEWRKVTSTPLFFCVVAGMAALIFVEAMQYKSLGKQYFYNIWNVCDVLSVTTTGAYLLSELSTSSSESFKAYMAAPALFLNWIGLLYYFRAFDRSAWIVYSLLFIFKKLSAFLLIVFTVILSFTTTFRALYKGSTPANNYDDKSNAFGNIISGFDTMLYAGLFGDYDDTILGETYSFTIARLLLSFLLYTVTVVSLNAMIAFISDIFERILAEKDFFLTQIKAETMLQLYCTMSESRRKKIEEANRWTYVLVPNSEVENVINGVQKPQENDEDDGTGMNRRATKQHLLNLETEVKKEMSNIMGRVNQMEDKMSQMEDKLDAILSALQISSEKKTEKDEDDTIANANL